MKGISKKAEKKSLVCHKQPHCWQNFGNICKFLTFNGNGDANVTCRSLMLDVARLEEWEITRVGKV